MKKLKEILASPFLLIGIVNSWIGSFIMGTEEWTKFVYKVVGEYHKKHHDNSR